jgi:hypothetical protein
MSINTTHSTNHKRNFQLTTSADITSNKSILKPGKRILNDIRLFPLTARGGNADLNLSDVRVLTKFINSERFKNLQDDPEQFMLCKNS